MRTVNILIPVKQPVGGIRTYLKYTYPYLKKNIYAITIVSPDKRYLNQMLKDLDTINIDVLAIKKSDSFYHFSKQIYKLINKKKYDIIHSQGFTAGVATVIANSGYKIPHIMTSHDVLRRDQFEGFQGWIKLRILELLFKNIDVLQSVSHDAQNNLIEFMPGLKAKKRKLKVIENGIDSTKFFNPYNDCSKKNNYKKDNLFTIGFIGRYMPQKGFLDLIDVVEILNLTSENFKFRILAVGKFSAFIREYKKAISIKGLNHYFEFVDFQESVNCVLRKIDVLIMPSLWEACPILPMEALVCGTPIIAYSCIGLREVLKNTPAITIDVNDKNGIARKILEVWSKYREIKKLFEDYMPKAKKRYDSRKCAKELENVIIKLIELKESNLQNRNHKNIYRNILS